MRVEGFVLIPAVAAPFSSATVYVRLLDVSMADAPSAMLAEQTLTGVSRSDRTDQLLPFALEADLPADWRGSLTVAAHVDQVGDGRVHPGDLLTTASHPVPPTGATGVVVRVDLVG